MKNSNLSKRLYDCLTDDYNNKQIRLVVLPDYFREGDSDGILCVSDGNAIEIICFRTFYLQVYSEARKVLNDRQSSQAAANEERYYLATTVLLLITPEDHSNIRRHEELLLNRLKDKNCSGLWRRDEIAGAFVRRELQFVTSCLTSSLARVNKSPSLWLLYRKLYIITNSLFPTIEANYEMCFSKSAEAHSSNYYSWHTLRWMFDVGSKQLKARLAEATETFCFKHPKDSSAWWSLAHVLVSSFDTQKNSIAQQNMLTANYSLPPLSELIFGCASSTEIESKVKKIVEYIDYAEVSEYPPFQCLEKLFQNLNQTGQKAYVEKWLSQIEVFERENFEIGESSALLSDRQLRENVLIQRDFKTLVMKKKFVQRLLPHNTPKSTP